MTKEKLFSSYLNGEITIDEFIEQNRTMLKNKCSHKPTKVMGIKKATKKKIAITILILMVLTVVINFMVAVHDAFGLKGNLLALAIVAFVYLLNWCIRTIQSND